MTRRGRSDLRRLRLIEGENRKLRQIVADLSLNKFMMQALGAWTLWTFPAMGAGAWVNAAHWLQPAASAAVGVHVSRGQLCASRCERGCAPMTHIRQIADTRLYNRYRRACVVLIREGAMEIGKDVSASP